MIDVPEAVRLPGEEWRPVVGWESRYLVSSMGRVWAMRRQVVCKSRWGTQQVTWKGGRICATHINSDGYLTAGLCRGSRTKSVLVHRLVAEAFLPPPPGPVEEFQVNHKDHKRSNAAAANLEWATGSENMKAAKLFHGGWSGAAGRDKSRQATATRWLQAGRRLAAGRPELAKVVDQAAAIIAATPSQRRLFGGEGP